MNAHFEQSGFIIMIRFTINSMVMLRVSVRVILTYLDSQKHAIYCLKVPNQLVCPLPVHSLCSDV